MKRRNFIQSIGLASIAHPLTYNLDAQSAKKPNVIIVITDDQGYGDLACHGHPWVKTPNMDKIHKESTRLTNYHVDPTCAPTRSALMTGRYSDRVGVWHTILGRNLLRAREKTMANVFADSGYKTGMFGKWHLGDAYPFRPHDRGFHHTVYHGGGGVTQGPDYWGNTYFDDTYHYNNTYKKYKGFCTDIWFMEAMNFIKKNKNQPFFCYLPTNAPHGPMRAPQEYLDLYKDKEGNPGFFGMISNIDDNLKKMDDFLKKEGLRDNTIFVFTTDNGSSSGWRIFNAGMRAGKGSQYDGGHRVPFFIRWPKGKIKSGKDINTLTAHVDILPTMIDLCGLKKPNVQFDGTSIKNLIYGDGKNWPERTLVVESQRVVTPEKWRKCAVMTQQWRLVDGKELYDIQKDPGQTKDVVKEFPEVVKKLTANYEGFWKSVSAEHHLFSRIIAGAEKQNPVTLNAHDILAGGAAWSQGKIASGGNAIGPWAIHIERDGNYKISLRRWAVEADKPINSEYNGKSINAKTLQLKIGKFDQTKKITDGMKEVTFKMKLKKGDYDINTAFTKEDGKQVSAFYAYVLNADIYKGDLSKWQTREGMNIPQAEIKKLPIKEAKKKKRDKKTKKKK